MKAHDVRSLRYCQHCALFAHKDAFLANGEMCIACAWTAAGGVRRFLELHGMAERQKLPLNLVGVEGMQWLLRKDSHG